MIFTGCLQVYSFPGNLHGIDTHRSIGKKRVLRFFAVRGTRTIVWRGQETPQVYLIHLWYQNDIDITKQLSIGDVIYLAGNIRPQVQVDITKRVARFNVFMNADWHESRVVAHAEITEGAIEAAREAEISRKTRA